MLQDKSTSLHWYLFIYHDDCTRGTLNTKKQITNNSK